MRPGREWEACTSSKSKGWNNPIFGERRSLRRSKHYLSASKIQRAPSRTATLNYAVTSPITTSSHQTSTCANILSGPVPTTSPMFTGIEKDRLLQRDPRLTFSATKHCTNGNTDTPPFMITFQGRLTQWRTTVHVYGTLLTHNFYVISTTNIHSASYGKYAT